MIISISGYVHESWNYLLGLGSALPQLQLTIATDQHWYTDRLTW